MTRLLAFYICMLVILFKASFPSTLSSGTSLPASTSTSSRNKKPIVGKLVRKRKLANAIKESSAKRTTRVGKDSKHKDIVAKKNKPKLLIDLLLKELVKLVIDYLDSDEYSIVVSTHRWSFKHISAIAVDNTRLYVITESEGINGLNHSFTNAGKDRHCCIELGNQHWSKYGDFGGSRNGRYVSFGHIDKELLDGGELIRHHTKWLAHCDESGNERLRPVAFDGENLRRGILSKDGLTLLCSYMEDLNPISRVYRIREEAGRDPVAFIKCELAGTARAVSGKGNRFLIEGAVGLEVHDIGKATRTLVCQIDEHFGYIWALNDDGSEAAFVNFGSDELRIVEVNKVVGSSVNQTAIVTVSRPAGLVDQLVYDDRGRLFVLHDGDKVSLFDPSTKKFISIKVPQEGQRILRAAISPNADCIATLQHGGEEGEKTVYTTIVECKFRKTDWRDLFGYEDPIGCVKTRNLLVQDASASLSHLTTGPAKGGSLRAFGRNLRRRHVSEDNCVGRLISFLFRVIFNLIPAPP